MLYIQGMISVNVKQLKERFNTNYNHHSLFLGCTWWNLIICQIFECVMMGNTKKNQSYWIVLCLDIKIKVIIPCDDVHSRFKMCVPYMEDGCAEREITLWTKNSTVNKKIKNIIFYSCSTLRYTPYLHRTPS